MSGHSNCAKPGLGKEWPRAAAETTTAPLGAATTAPSTGSPPPTAQRGDADSEARYVLTDLHAAGGIGRVWLARDRHLDRDVAIKELFPEHAGKATIAARFIREAQLTGQLEHPGVVPVYELDRGAGANQPFYAMKFVRGRTLRSAVDAYHAKRAQGGADSLEFVALLAAFAAVCNTIAYAHSRGVLHRDLKGDNVILGDFGEVIVLDWGLAKIVGQPETIETDQSSASSIDTQDPGLTIQGDIVGTPAYMAPEQAEGRLDQIDRRTDIYGLGAILYEILTGRPPFTGANTREVLQRVIRGNPAPPRKFSREVPGGLEEICLKALAKDPDQRYASATDLAIEVQCWQERRRPPDGGAAAPRRGRNTIPWPTSSPALSGPPGRTAGSTSPTSSGWISPG